MVVTKITSKNPLFRGVENSQNAKKKCQIEFETSFQLSEMQRLIKRCVRKFSEEKLTQNACEIDQTSCFNLNIIDVLSSIGAWGIQIPEKYGGAELDSISYAIVIEELSRICASTGLTVSVHNSLGSYPILRWGTEEQKERFLYDLSSGKKLAAFAWTEPNAGSDANNLESLALQEGNHFILNGAKTFITNGGIGSIFIVGARYKSESGSTGIATFIVEKGMEGFEIGKIEKKLGLRGASVSSLYFNDVRIPMENVLGGLGNGFKNAMEILDVGRIGIGAQAVGIAQAAYERSIEYSNGRIQFKKPISEFQGISFKLAEMATKIDAARLLVHRAANLKDRNIKFSKEAAMCKLFASKVARQVTQQALQIHGGYGCMQDLPIERYFRDSKLCEIYEGTSEIMKLIIAQQILKGNI